MTILVLGDANADLSAAVPRFPAEGDDSQITALGWGSGGSAANVGAALALLGAPARLLTRIGRDPAAEIALRMARAAGADLTMVQLDDTLATGLCFAAVSPGGERTFFSYRGANANFEFDPNQAGQLDGAHWLHISGYALLEGRQRTAALALIDAAGARHIPISLDVCLPQLRAWHAETIALLPRLRILFTNAPELAVLTANSTNTEHSIHLPDDIGVFTLHPLLQQGLETVAIKLGPRGCLIASDRTHHYAPAFAVDAIDTNGCGDAFVAGYLFAHLRGAAVEHSATLANAIGALKATRLGAAEALPNRAMLRAFLEEHHSPAWMLALLGFLEGLRPSKPPCGRRPRNSCK
jgi:sugar/nucleoside kinase (ribokinase family)